MERVLHNPRSGERIVIRRSDAELLEFDVFLRPGAHVPGGHIHPEQEERFTVLEGQVRFRVDGRETVTAPGAQVTVASGTRHWFGNAGPTPAHVRVEVRPALRMEDLLAASARCDHWVDLLLIPLDFSRELAIPYLPRRLVRAALRPLSLLRSAR
jgi:quercetin dioxygenase-like cupin family protein